MGPHPMTDVLIRRGKFGTRSTQREEARDWSHAATAKEHHGLPANTRSWEEARKDPPLEPSERAWP